MGIAALIAQYGYAIASLALCSKTKLCCCWPVTRCTGGRRRDRHEDDVPPVLVHGLVSFGFNLLVLALTINLVASALG